MIVPTTGGVGVDGLVFMVMLPDEAEVHPEELVTVNVYVPDGIPATVVLVPVPVVVVPPGDRVKVQDGRIVWCVFPSPIPDSGKKPPAVPGAKP